MSAATCPTESGPPPDRTLSKRSMAVPPHFGRMAELHGAGKSGSTGKSRGRLSDRRTRLFQSVRELLAELCDLRRDDDPAIARGRVLAEVVLMVLLRSVERLQRREFRDDRPAPDSSFEYLRHDLPS